MRWLKLAFLFLSAPLFGQQLGFALEQINGHAIIDAGLSGKGVKVGIIDGGFLKANKSTSLEHVFENNLVAGYKDYLYPDAKPYSGSAGFDDAHGTEVWELVAGHSKEKKVQYGLATGATFYLARTDHGGYEKRQEEEYAIEAMEWMAKEGVNIINISLGYNYGFSDKRENYHPYQMDGKSTILTQAVDRISTEYGILVIVAAGNDGNHKWKIIGSPGDAVSALTVGATKFKVWDEMKYTSKGPKWLEYVKPEIAAYASLGTSFSAPVITGLAACLLEAKPSLDGQELKDILIASSSLACPNNYIGYGVPDAEKALALLNGDSLSFASRLIKVDKNSYTLEMEKPSIYTAVYHKDDWRILKKEMLRNKKARIKIKRKEDATSSTVIWEGGSLEVVWEESH
ncbi:S8 family serine peptidase [Ekhidna sp.]|uniref:S8 family serine peptidase n=1 Tax=Ekhidna sp. TaxID=2608089 RepID=UPI003CCB8B0E